MVLFSLAGNDQRQAASIGRDVVAVTVSDDGSTAFLADSEPGDVYAVALPELTVRWRTHTGGAPFGLLMYDNRLAVSLYDAASVVELDPSSGRVLSTHTVGEHPAAMTVDPTGQLAVATAGDFGIAVTGGDVWTADYRGKALVDLTHPKRVALPLPVAPFWLSPGTPGTLLVAAEGASEDSDPGAVFSYDTMSGTFVTLATPRDPDQVVESGSTIFVAAHGDRDVLAIDDHRVSRRAQGWAAVALAPDPQLGALVVAVNAHE